MPSLLLTSLAGLAIAYSSPSEHDIAREKYIQEINKTPGILWKAAAQTRFKGQPIGAAKRLCGVKPTSEAEKHKLVSSGMATWGQGNITVDLPESFDSAQNWPQCAIVIDDIRDQSNCGCCWAFGAAEAASGRMCIASNGTMKMPLSSQDTCFCASTEGCNGGQLYTAWNYIKESGLVTGGQYAGYGQLGGGWCSAFSLPHCHHHGPQRDDPFPAEGQPGCPHVDISPQCPRNCDSAANSTHADFTSDKYSFTGSVTFWPSNEEAIMQAIMTGGPVEAAFTVYSDFENYSGGIYHKTSDEPLGGHAIRIVGWGVENGVKYWKIANSWNPYWGENGYFRIVKGTNECGIEEQTMSSSNGAQWGKMNPINMA